MRDQGLLPFASELGIFGPAENVLRALHGERVAAVPEQFQERLRGRRILDVGWYCNQGVPDNDLVSRETDLWKSQNLWKTGR